MCRSMVVYFLLLTQRMVDNLCVKTLWKPHFESNIIGWNRTPNESLVGRGEVCVWKEEEEEGMRTKDTCLCLERSRIA